MPSIKQGLSLCNQIYLSKQVFVNTTNKFEDFVKEVPYGFCMSKANDEGGGVKTSVKSSRDITVSSLEVWGFKLLIKVNDIVYKWFNIRIRSCWE